MNTKSKYVIVVVNMESITKHLLSILSTKYVIGNKNKGKTRKTVTVNDIPMETI